MKGVGASILVSIVVLFAGCGKEAEKPPKEPQEVAAMPETFDHERLTAIGPEACVECHADVVESWKGSHHAHANRPVSRQLDTTAFWPARTYEEPGVDYKLERFDDSFVLQETRDGHTRTYPLAGVIAYKPLRQYLAPFQRGQYQTTSLAYDPELKEWFDVFADGRQPGEWGHWTGQGMNWNANCAYCHMTEFVKDFDPATETYHSTWLQQGIACAQCHDGLMEHVHEARLPDYQPGKLVLDEAAVMASCATCHSRREQLTPDTFRPGDAYDDHFALSLPDHPGLYYPDGQIRDEDFVYGSFMMSRMGHAGVTCADCHNPHSGDTILPVANNSLCMRCHSVGLDNAPIIQETAHSYHAAGSTGNLCINCHMPHTTYMQRDPRRDHGFLSPDPLMTRELGIPNACSTCHAEESLDWAVEHAEAWYGEKLATKPQRARARALATAYAGEPAAEALLRLAASEDIPAWKAVYTGLLGNYLGEPHVISYLRAQLDDDSPWVRARAVTSLTPVPDVGPLLMDRLADPVRQVRIAAARSVVSRGETLPEGEAEKDWQTYLEFNADRPQDMFVLAQQAIESGDESTARQRIVFAVSLDRANAEVHRRAAILYSMLGDNTQAGAALETALNIAPQNPDVLYSLALLRAEEGRLEEAAALLEDVVMVAPDFYRAWYNLSLAYVQLGRWQDASVALDEAAPAMSQDPNYLRTRAVIDRMLNR